MFWKDWKYLLAYIIPIIVVLSLYFQGFWSYGGLIVAFIIIPTIEFFLTGTKENLSPEEETTQNNKQLFDLFLYLNVPILWALTGWYLYLVQYGDLATYEFWGLSITMGIFLGGIGINVAHELGHRNTWHEQLMAKILLLPNLYMHFFIEHNRGHHVNIATDKDPASARFNENIYTFYLRSISLSYISAWELENRRLRQQNKNVFSFANEMIWYHIIQIGYLLIIGFLLSPYVALAAILVACIGFLMLETVNYIEHYGLRRKQLESGRFERVMPWHSWNSNHELGRILLYELTRHSDHHYKASRKYQILQHHDATPMLPYGYPASMLIALIPPLWFAVMNPKVEYYRSKIPQIAA